MSGLEVAVATRSIIGESPTWSAPEQALYWIDIKEPALHRYTLATGEIRTWPLTSDVGTFALCGDNAVIVALREGVYRLDLTTGLLNQLAPPPFDPSLFRFNEGICDHTGRFWVGVMFDPIDPARSPGRGYLHSFTLEDGLRRENDTAELHNGMAISRDGTQFFVSHSNEKVILVFDFDAAAGTLGSCKEFARIQGDIGIPDGAAIDADGCYWCAIHGGGRLRRYTPTGMVDREILLPVSKPTMCAFGGENLETLYVTSASEGVGTDEPLAGAILRLKPGVKGIGRGSNVFRNGGSSKRAP